VLADDEVDAVVVSTPADSHHEITRRVLDAGKHALVEKPLAMRASECDELGALAEAAGLTLMVGHTFLYNSALRWVRDHVHAGDLGEVLYVYTQRLNLGRVRPDINVLWNLAPHDVAILLHLLRCEPLSVSARGHGYVHPGVEDVVFLTMDFPDGCLGNVHVSWLDPRKVRRVTVVGTKKMVVYDDVDVEARVQVYDKGIDIVPSPEANGGRRHENLGEFQALVRSGDLLVPKIEFEEPLRVQCREFVDAIREGRPPLTDARHARQVVAVLEAASTSLAKGGERIFLEP
jgi:predicted dehydrogenase